MMCRLIPTGLILLMLAGCDTMSPGTHDLTLDAGKVERFAEFPSAYISPRTVDIWLPEGYPETRPYRVLYMHDGQMLYDARSTWNQQAWEVDDMMSRLMDDGEILPAIVVGVWNTELRHSEYFPQKPFEQLPAVLQDSLLHDGEKYAETALFKSEILSDRYLRFIVEELKPFIDRRYATFTEPEHTLMMGSSMGGLISMYALCEYPEVFGRVACLSTHWVGTFDTTNNPIPAAFASYLETHLPDPTNHRIYFDHGTETLDAFYGRYQLQVDSVMRRRGYDAVNWQTRIFEGTNHSEDAWKDRLDIPLRFLLGK